MLSATSFNVKLLRVLANSKRLAIIYLLQNQELCVLEICKSLDLPQSNISQHLMLLRKLGIVTSRKEGKCIMYTLVPQKIFEAINILNRALPKSVT